MAQKAARQASAWLALESDPPPGIAGTDYRASRITVVFKRNAALPAGWPAGKALAAGSRAADQPNPMLRPAKQYEPVADAIVSRYGLAIRQQVYMGEIRFASFELPVGMDGAVLLARLRVEAAGMVEHAIFARLSHARYVPNDPDFQQGPGGAQWSHWQVDCTGAWDITRGDSGTMVAVVDTGVRLSHEEMNVQVINPQTEFPAATCDIVNSDKTIEDNDGHGTFIAGMICAQGDNARTICGVAPLCRVLPVKISNDGSAWNDDLVAGALLAGQLGARAINYSFGGYFEIPQEEQMVDQLTSQGKLFVCAAGNDGTATDEWPSSFANACSTGATDEFDNCCDFSNWGVSVDVAAPGQDLKSCAPFSNSDYDSAGAGTSYAAPMVTASAGLLWSYNPALTLAQVRSALLGSGPVATNFMQPIHRLDIGAALQSVYVPVVPTIAGVSLPQGSVLGVVPSWTDVALSVAGPSNVARVVYTLDVAPVGTIDASDPTAESLAGGAFPVQLSCAGLHNQLAQLRVDYFAPGGESGSSMVGPVWIFNQRGDVDGDSVVGPSDLIELGSLTGKGSADAGFIPYADADRDGRITEADAAAIGYFWGTGASAPQIASVTPTDLVTGAQASMTASVNGSGILTYDWDFGGGAVPNTSTLPAPTIIAGAVGSYSASLTVSNGFFSDNYGFSLVISPRPGPTAVLDATPRIGQPPLDVSFDAGGSSAPGGSIVQYDWSWDGDATWEDTTVVPTNSHQFNTLGDYTVRLRVTDDLSATAEATVDISVSDSSVISDYGEYELGSWGSGGSTDNLRLSSAEIDGKPAIIWIKNGTPDDEIYVAVAQVSTPTSVSDWRIDMVFSGEAEIPDATAGICDIDNDAGFLFGLSTGLKYGRYHGSNFSIHDVPGPPVDGTLANIAGRPAFFCTGSGSHFVYANNSDPSVESEWTNVQIDDLDFKMDSTYEFPYHLMDIGGLPMIQGQSLGDRAFNFSIVNPPGSLDWDSFVFNSDNVSDSYGYSFVDGGLPAMLYNVDDGGSKPLFYSKAGNMHPVQASDWTTYEIYFPQRIEMAASIGGLPAAANRSGLLVMALSSSPTNNNDWVIVTVPSGFKGRRLISHGGLPAYFAVDSDKVIYRYPIL